MKSFVFIAAALSALANFVEARGIAERDATAASFSHDAVELSSDGYSVSSVTELTWHGEVVPNQPKMSFTGTAKQIYEKIMAINPDYPGAKHTDEELASQFQKRAEVAGINCDAFNWVNWQTILEGYNYLRRIGDGECGAPPGRPGEGGCGRISCSYNAGIWVCNDNPWHVHMSCAEVAEAAGRLMAQCKNGDRVRGQLFTKDNWNVIFNSARC